MNRQRLKGYSKMKNSVYFTIIQKVLFSGNTKRVNTLKLFWLIKPRKVVLLISAGVLD